MNGPPKQKRRRAKTAFRKRLIRAYYVSGFFANIFEKPFGFFQQLHWRIADRLDNERDDEDGDNERSVE
jgi:hypothetical protein